VPRSFVLEAALDSLPVVLIQVITAQVGVQVEALD
jgi:hypothetical protein